MGKKTTQKRRTYIPPLVEVLPDLSVSESLLNIGSVDKTDDYTDGGEGGWEQTSSSSTSAPSFKTQGFENYQQQSYKKGLWDDGGSE